MVLAVLPSWYGALCGLCGPVDLLCGRFVDFVNLLTRWHCQMVQRKYKVYLLNKKTSFSTVRIPWSIAIVKSKKCKSKERVMQAIMSDLHATKKQGFHVTNMVSIKIATLQWICWNNIAKQQNKERTFTCFVKNAKTANTFFFFRFLFSVLG